jgi:hypothetical protein
MCIDALAKTADILNIKGDANKYKKLKETVKAAFLQQFYNAETKTFKNNGSPQTAHAMALCADLVPEHDKQAVLQAIIDDLEKRDYQQTSGDAGHLFFIRALAQAGRSDVLHKVYSRTGLGSYGGILAKGLTAMPETWDAITVGSNSLNHCMLGHVMEWFHGWVLGIRQDEGSIGWQKVLIAPEVGDLKNASGWLETPQGRIEVAWKAEAGVLIEVTVPKGTSAKVVAPYGDHLALDGKFVRPERENGKMFVIVGPGKHEIIASPWEP